MQGTTKTLMKALAKHIAAKVTTGRESLAHQEAARQAFRESMSERIAPMIKAATDLQRKEGLPHYLDCYAGHTAAAEAQQAHDENFLDAVKHVAKGVASGIAQDGLGINTKAIGRVVRALRKKKPNVIVSKVPTRTKGPKPKATPPAATEPISIDRREFAKRLKASGNRLDKTSLS
jgi:hypothetical protein